MSTEVGKRAYNLHIQGVFETHFPANEYKLLGKIFHFNICLIKYEYILYIILFSGKVLKRDYMPHKGVGHKITLKPFAKGQTFVGMLGYCTKDNGTHHFGLALKGVSPEVCYNIYNVYKTVLLLRPLNNTI